MLKINGKIILALFLGFSLAPAVVEAKDHGKHKGQHSNKHQKHNYEYSDPDEWRNEYRHSDSDSGKRHRSHPDYDDDVGYRERLVYIIQDNRYTGYQSLPPGIRKNLARGKPIPPGLAYQIVPPPVLSILPVYPGTEWRVYGTDLVLINLANQLIQQTILGIFH